jgi:hypothetical protein
MSGTPYSRMLSLGSREGSTPIEDFLTEALAAATNRDSRPLIAALQTQPGLARTLNGHNRVKAETQVSLKGAGRLDLVIEPASGAQVWIEVKAFAGEHGNQLRTYARQAKRIRPNAKLVLLARPGVMPSIKIPKISWGTLLSAVGNCHKPSDLWLELCEFIKEKDLGSDLSWPLTKVEAKRLKTKEINDPTVVKAIRKLKNFATQIEEILSVSFPRQWYANIEKVSFIENQVQSLGRVVYQFEAVERKPRSTSKDPYIMVWAGFEENVLKVGVEGRKNVDIKIELSASFSKLVACGWVQEQKNILAVGTKKLGFATEERAIHWVLDKFGELQNTGAYTLIQAASKVHKIDYYDR